LFYFAHRFSLFSEYFLNINILTYAWNNSRSGCEFSCGVSFIYCNPTFSKTRCKL